MTSYLTVSHAEAIHQRLIDLFGGSSGVRDRGLLEAAIARPQSGYYADLYAEAAALWESLAQNHPFIDGNKRVAFGATYAFLSKNGLIIVADPLEAYAFIIGLYEAGTFKFEALDAWLRAHAHPA